MPAPALADQPGANEEYAAASASRPGEIVVAATRLYNARAGYTIRYLDLSSFCNNLANSTASVEQGPGNRHLNLVKYPTFSSTTVNLSANVSFSE